MSPIEDRLWDHIVSRFSKLDIFHEATPDTAMATMNLAAAHGEGSAVVATRQFPFSSYVVDIAFLAFTMRSRGGNIFLAIECDGHDYHERTKEQAARDKSRDRALVAAGFSVLRFTGSEIWHRPDQCVDEICEVLGNEFQRRCEYINLGGHL